LSLATLSLFARGLGPDRYAWFAIASAGSAMGVAVLLQPLQQTLGRYLPGNDPLELTATLARVMFVIIGLALLVTLGVELFGGGSIPRGLALAAWALGSSQALFDFAGKYASTRLMPTRFGMMYVAKAVLVFGVATLLIERFDHAAFAAAIVCLSSLTTTLTIGWPAWRDATKGRYSAQWLPRLRSFALPLALTMFVSAVLQWADRFVLAGRVPAADLGIYAAAADLTQQSLGLLGSSLYLAWLPRLVTAHETRDAGQRSAVEGHYAVLVLAVFLPALIGFVWVRTELIEVFFGAAYIERASLVMPWIAIASVLGLLRTFVFDVGLYLAGRMSTQLRNVAVSAALGLALNVAFVGQFGIWAAVVAALVAQSVALMLSWQSGRDVVAWHVSAGQCGRVALSCAAMLLVLALVPGRDAVALAFRIAAAAVTYGGAMLALNGASSRDWLVSQLVRQAQRRREAR
jgi:O-antigen/teichoic acid export membrane protein